MQVTMLFSLVLSEDDGPFFGVLGFFPQTIHSRGLRGGHFQFSIYSLW